MSSDHSKSVKRALKSRRELFEDQLRSLQEDLSSLSIKMSESRVNVQSSSGASAGTGNRDSSPTRNGASTSSAPKSPPRTLDTTSSSSHKRVVIQEPQPVASSPQLHVSILVTVDTQSEMHPTTTKYLCFNRFHIFLIISLLNRLWNPRARFRHDSIPHLTVLLYPAMSAMN